MVIGSPPTLHQPNLSSKSEELSSISCVSLQCQVRATMCLPIDSRVTTEPFTRGADDDGEHGTERVLLRSLIDNEQLNVTVVVSRWY